MNSHPGAEDSAEAPDAAERFEEHRDSLFSVAYRMVGSVAEAEDLVQEAYLRWRGSDVEIQSPGGYLTRTVTRLAIDHLRSARVRRETYVGQWLPDPLVTPRGEAPADPTELAESLSAAFLLMLERLAPVERAVFLLREVFGYEYDEIGRIVDRSPAACRQIAKRCRERVARDRPRFDADPREAERIADRFISACATGDFDGLLPLLSDDVVNWSDSGGLVQAAHNPIHGAEKCARFWIGVTSKREEGTLVRPVMVNGVPGFVIRPPGGPVRVLGFRIEGGRIHDIFVFSNPERLARLELPLD